jgi:hypothetical protein
MWPSGGGSARTRTNDGGVKLLYAAHIGVRALVEQGSNDAGELKLRSGATRVSANFDSTAPSPNIVSGEPDLWLGVTRLRGGARAPAGRDAGGLGLVPKRQRRRRRNLCGHGTSQLLNGRVGGLSLLPWGKGAEGNIWVPS